MTLVVTEAAVGLHVGGIRYKQQGSQHILKNDSTGYSSRNHKDSVNDFIGYGGALTLVNGSPFEWTLNSHDLVSYGYAVMAKRCPRYLSRITLLSQKHVFILKLRRYSRTSVRRVCYETARRGRCRRSVLRHCWSPGKVLNSRTKA